MHANDYEEKEADESLNLGVIYSLVFVAFVDYSLISPFIPPQAAALGMNMTLISLVFSSYFIWGALFSIIAGNIASTLGRRNIIMLGATVQALAVVWTGFLYNSTDVHLFELSLFMIRFFQGAGDGLVTIGVYSLLSIYYEGKDYQSKLALVNMIVGVGIAFGPIIGEYSVMYFNDNYQQPMWIIGGLHLMLVAVAYMVIKDDLTRVLKKKNSYKDVVAPTYRKILSHPRVLLNYLSCLLAIGCISIPQPVLSVVMKGPTYNSTNMMIGVYLCLLNLSEVLGSLVIAYSPKMDYGRCIMFGQLTMAASLFVIGQVYMDLLAAPYSLVPLGVGLFFLGLGMVYSFIIVVPATMEYLEGIYIFEDLERELWNDKVSGLFGMFYESGGFFVPFMGGVLMDWIGFEHMCFLWSFVPLTFVIVYYSVLKIEPIIQHSVETEMVYKDGK